MPSTELRQDPWGLQWRSSTSFVTATVCIALFSETFLYGFVVPILPHILEKRNHRDPSDTQRLTYIILTLYSGTSMLSGFLIGHIVEGRSRRTSLLAALFLALIGTCFLAASHNLALLVVGRFFQAVGGTGAWVVGYATLRAAVDQKNLAKAFGLLQSFICLGALSGSAVAGLLLDLFGYWVAWAAVMAVLSVDIIMRLVMIEKLAEESPSPDRGDDDESGENRALLSGTPARPYSGAARSAGSAVPAVEEPSPSFFYWVVLSQPRVIVALFCSFFYASLVASFNTTIPVHVREAFDWGSLQAGLLYTSQPGPAIILSPISGWLRDTYGTKLPAGVGFALLSPLLWLLGAADLKQFPWAATLASAKRTYVATLVMLGCVMNLASSTGPVEVTRAVTDIQKKRPGIFGEKGGYTRAYSLTNAIFSFGLFMGPLLSGILADNVGYFYMNCVLASICVVASILALSFLEGKPK